MSVFLNCLAVGGGGACGAVCRYLLGLLPLNRGGFPLSTLAINVLGSFLMGLIIAVSGKALNADPRLILFLQVGFCGGFTTFSTFANETFVLLESGRFVPAILYVTLSVVLCVAAVFLARFFIR